MSKFQFYNLNLDKNFVKFCKKLKESHIRFLKIEKITEATVIEFLDSVLSSNSKEISADGLENIKLESSI